ncbi:hypothetical protein EG68_04954 [Paragonimus skrjabini miyazakii]|uniref:Uncharacterized protein n=1 Tax=Paragonimus skrjabini miyazakii TaxID=59628 RepID=A0A8S9Z5F1_9TREM|nr:hypothetical protein EG68_04954 [Paragonimus skrjabini miyazakii]
MRLQHAGNNDMQLLSQSHGIHNKSVIQTAVFDYSRQAFTVT